MYVGMLEGRIRLMLDILKHFCIINVTNDSSVLQDKYIETILLPIIISWLRIQKLHIWQLGNVYIYF